MRIAVVQHQLRPAPAQDLEALVIAAARAAAEGADVVLLPGIPALQDGPLNDELWRRLAEATPGLGVFVPRTEVGAAAVVDDLETLGRTGFLPGDTAFEPVVLSRMLDERPELVVLAPGAESELQAQAVLELAVGLSTSLAPLAIVLESSGAEVGEPGHGGSAIVYLGEVMAEAVDGDDLLVVEVATPLGQPEPRSALPEVPTLLAQRVASHDGRKLEVDYPADLS